MVPPRSSPSRPPVSTVIGRAARIDSYARTLAGQGPTAATQLSRYLWDQHGDRVHDLNDRADVGRLITRSPLSDDARCAGAALFNGLLLDGNSVANARAIECTATKRDVPLSDSERWALASMRAHHLTPYEAATLQDTLFRIAGTFGGELAATLAALRALGGFPNTRSANFRMERTGQTSFHWTATSTGTHGTAHADSWPQLSGQATVGGGPGATEFHHEGRFMHAFIADVTMSETIEGTTLRARSIHGKPGDVLPSAIRSRTLFLANGKVRKGPVEHFNPANGALIRNASPARAPATPAPPSPP